MILIVVLSIFDLTYIFRASYQIYFALNVIEKDNHGGKFIIFEVLSATIFDYIPLSLVLFIHSINFRTVVNHNYGQDKTNTAIPPMQRTSISSKKSTLVSYEIFHSPCSPPSAGELNDIKDDTEVNMTHKMLLGS